MDQLSVQLIQSIFIFGDADTLRRGLRLNRTFNKVLSVDNVWSTLANDYKTRLIACFKSIYYDSKYFNTDKTFTNQVFDWGIVSCLNKVHLNKPLTAIVDNRVLVKILADNTDLMIFNPNRQLKIFKRWWIDNFNVFEYVDIESTCKQCYNRCNRWYNSNWLPFITERSRITYYTDIDCTICYCSNQCAWDNMIQNAIYVNGEILIQVFGSHQELQTTMPDKVSGYINNQLGRDKNFYRIEYLK